MIRRITALRPSMLLLSCLTALAVAGCGSGPDSGQNAPGPREMTDTEYEAWEISLVEMRIDKNETLRDPQQTPLQEKDLPGFEGLNYFFPERNLVYRVPLVAAAATDTVYLQKRKGQTVPYLRRGTVSFRHDENVYSLDVFGPADKTHGDYLWLPFSDATTGKSTYAGGRYLDLEQNEDGTVDLDFNYAYNPLCDYNPERYNCTLPPAGNTLDFAVEAGEMSFGAEH